MKFKALAGLGNPGKYEGTYHNVGIDFVRRFADLHEKSGIFSGKNFQAEKSGSLFCIFPSTFMNESGEAIRQAVKHLDISSEELLIAHDDSDLPVGKYRFSFGRGAAGHHGVESVISHLKTKDFWRLFRSL
jgi:PTH1 family peptidyl-tRNA hydrolase